MPFSSPRTTRLLRKLRLHFKILLLTSMIAIAMLLHGCAHCPPVPAVPVPLPKPPSYLLEKPHVADFLSEVEKLRAL